MHPHIASRPVATKDEAPLGALRLLSIVDFTTSPRELSNFLNESLNEILKLSGTNDGKAKLRSHARMPQLLNFLISRAGKSNRKNSRTVILAILSNLASNDSMRAVIGASANGLIVSALGLDPSSATNTAEDDDVAMHSTLYALRLMTRITVIATIRIGRYRTGPSATRTSRDPGRRSGRSKRPRLVRRERVSGPLILRA